MAHLSRLLVMFFLGFHVSHGFLLPPSYDESMCSESFSCGSVDITYPFYLSNATQASQDYTSNYSCGYTDLKIFCQGEGKAKIPILQLRGDNYTILNIFYGNNTIVLADTDVLRSGNGCPRVIHNVSFSQEWLNYTNSLDSLAFFFDCYSKQGDDLPRDFPTEDYQINCNPDPAAGTGDGVSFVFISGSQEVNVSEEYDLADHCKQNFVVPIREDALVRSGQHTLPTAYGGVLKQGFELKWNQGTGQSCHLCEESGGHCAYSENKEFLGCLCSHGKVDAQICHGSGASAASTSSKSGILKCEGGSTLEWPKDMETRQRGNKATCIAASSWRVATATGAVSCAVRPALPTQPANLSPKPRQAASEHGL